MVTFLLSLDSTLVNVLAVIGILIIVSGALKTLWEFVRHETERKNQIESGGKNLGRFSFMRSHLTFSIVLSVPLFIVKFLDDAVNAQSSSAYLYLLALVTILVILIFSYRKDKKNATEEK